MSSSSFVSSSSTSSDNRTSFLSEQKGKQQIQYKQKLKGMEQKNGGIVPMEKKFGKPESSHYEILVQETVGLVTLEEFVKKRDHIVGGTYDEEKKTEMEKERELKRLNRKSKVQKTQLSFDMEEEDQHYATTEVSKKEKKQEIEETKEVGENESFVAFQEPKPKKQKTNSVQ